MYAYPELKLGMYTICFTKKLYRGNKELSKNNKKNCLLEDQMHNIYMFLWKGSDQ